MRLYKIANSGILSLNKRLFSATGGFGLKHISPKAVNAKYAVRGSIVNRAEQIKKELKDGKKFPFKKVYMFNIGNPQQLGQIPITYMRQLMAACLYPELMDKNILPSDICDRAKRILGSKGTIGAYTESKGLLTVRETVANSLTKRDNVKSDPSDVYLTNGASPAIKNLMHLLISSKKCGVMIPIPQYPLYSAIITLLGGTKVGFFLDEKDNWNAKMSEIKRAYSEAISSGVTPKAICIINPGNPAGQILTRENIEGIIEFARKKNLVILADEVYQKNIYHPERKFQSFRKVVSEMGEKYKNTAVCSLDSVSKGIFGECGIRGGYVEFTNATEDFKNVYMKLSTMNLCSNLAGQIAVDVSNDHPKRGDVSYEKFESEYNKIFDSLKRRADLISERLSSIKGIRCKPTMGAMYSFPTIEMPEKARAEADKRGMAADEMYCFELLNETGICTVHGTGFLQKENTFHLRITILPPEEEFEDVFAIFEKFHLKFMAKYE